MFVCVYRMAKKVERGKAFQEAKVAKAGKLIEIRIQSYLEVRKKNED